VTSEIQQYDDRFLAFLLALACTIGRLIPAEDDSEKSSRDAGQTDDSEAAL
jgi:hypothetical protein